MASSRSPFLICSFSRVRAAPGFSVPGESTGGTTPSPTLRPSVVPEGHHHPLCAILPVCLGQKYSEGCVSPSQQHLHPCELLAATAIPVLVPPAVRGPHGITAELSTLPPAHFSAPQHVARWEHEAFPKSTASRVTHPLFLRRGHQVRRGHGVPHGAALAGPEQPLQGEAQLHHPLCR